MSAVVRVGDKSFEIPISVAERFLYFKECLDLSSNKAIDISIPAIFHTDCELDIIKILTSKITTNLSYNDIQAVNTIKFLDFLHHEDSNFTNRFKNTLALRADIQYIMTCGLDRPHLKYIIHLYLKYREPHYYVTINYIHKEDKHIASLIDVYNGKCNQHIELYDEYNTHSHYSFKSTFNFDVISDLIMLFCGKSSKNDHSISFKSKMGKNMIMNYKFKLKIGNNYKKVFYVDQTSIRIWDYIIEYICENLKMI